MKLRLQNRILGIAWASCAALGCCMVSGCDASNPQEMAQGFFEAVAAGETTRARSYFVEETGLLNAILAGLGGVVGRGEVAQGGRVTAMGVNLAAQYRVNLEAAVIEGSEQLSDAKYIGFESDGQSRSLSSLGLENEVGFIAYSTKTGKTSIEVGLVRLDDIWSVLFLGDTPRTLLDADPVSVLLEAFEWILTVDQPE